MGAVEILREVMTLTGNVGALRSDVDSLARRVEENRERIIRLENREDLLKSEMARQATEGVARLMSDVATRLTRLEQTSPALGEDRGTRRLPPEAG